MMKRKIQNQSEISALWISYPIFFHPQILPPWVNRKVEYMEQSKKIGDNVNQASCMWNAPVSLNALLLGIGYPKLSPSSSITNKAYAFSDAVFGWPEEDRGSAKGAFRHILWQSDMTAEFGDDVAQKIGDCHEREQPLYPWNSFFTSIDDADRTVDHLNNIIGRRIGNKFKYLSTKDRALEILRIGFVEGFYSVLKRGESLFEIIKEPMSYDEYERKRQQILRLDDNGRIKE
jgi:hypothetical protein